GVESPGLVVHPVLARARRSDAEACTRVLARIVADARLNADARRRFGGLYLRNTIANLPALVESPGVDVWGASLAGAPAIVLGAGPSLDANLATLAGIDRMNERALLVAVDTALKPMLAAGLEPHLVVAVDPAPANARTLLECDMPEHAWLVAEASLDPRVVERFAGRVALFPVGTNHPWPWLRQTAGLVRPTLRAWGSVLVSAYDLALQLGCDPVVFAGADLAYTGGRPYCRHTIYDADWARRIADGSETLESIWDDIRCSHELIEELGVDGAPTMAPAHLMAVRDWLAADAAKRPERRIVNASGGGLLKGSHIRLDSLADVTSAPVDPRLRRDAVLAPLTSARPREPRSSIADRVDRWLATPRGDRGESWLAWSAIEGLSPLAIEAAIGDFCLTDASPATRWSQHGWRLLQLGRHADAVTAFERALAADVSPDTVVGRLVAWDRLDAHGPVGRAWAPEDVEAFEAARAADLWHPASDDVLDLCRRVAGPRIASTLDLLVPCFTRPAADAASGLETVRVWRELHASDYFAGHPAYRERLGAMGVERVRRLLVPESGERLLELGCGFGRLLHHLRSAVDSVVGVDIADEPLREARALVGDIGSEWPRTDGFTLWPVATASVDCAVSFTVLQHLSREQVPLYLRELRRVVRTGGRVCLQFRTGGNTSAHLTLAPVEQSLSHSATSVVSMAETAGFQIVTLEREHFRGEVAFLWLLAEAV
ncbi:MAG: 6-hydroxymethylpterin diphosphokinase MptE-like protein, partial [Vicinamibacterales bacterium]